MTFVVTPSTSNSSVQNFTASESVRNPCAIGAAERAVLRALGVDVDPLVVVGGVGEQVDAVLRDLEPVGVAEVGAGQAGGVGVGDGGGHGVPFRGQ